MSENNSIKDALKEILYDNPLDEKSAENILQRILKKLKELSKKGKHSV